MGVLGARGSGSLDGCFRGVKEWEPGWVFQGGEGVGAWMGVLGG